MMTSQSPRPDFPATKPPTAHNHHHPVGHEIMGKQATQANGEQTPGHNFPQTIFIIT